MAENMENMQEIPKTKAECEAAGGTWHEEDGTCTLTADGTNATQSVTPDVASLLRENERLKAQLDVRNKQIKQAIGVANRANDERKAREEAEKDRLIQSIQMDGKFDKDELKKKSLDELNIMRMTLDKSLEKTFASVAAELDAMNHKKEPLLTAGAWDSKKKDWVGGT